jgi:hypothetical protein
MPPYGKEDLFCKIPGSMEKVKIVRTRQTADRAFS